MGTLKRLLLGSVSLLAGAAGAQAADLPAGQAASIEYVRVCDAYGAGFFAIPGTDTCLRTGGYVRYEFEYSPSQKIINPTTGAVSQIGASQDSTGMEIRGRIDVDARTATPWGTVQTVVHLRATDTDGIRHDSDSTQFQTSITPAGDGSTSLTMERAFIRFAGFTFGLQDENFNTAGGSHYFFGSQLTTSGFTNGVKAISYTAVFPNGVTWENSIESRGDFDFDGYSWNTVGVAPTPTFANSTYRNDWLTGYNLVSVLTDTQKWGHVGLSGALGDNTFLTNDAAALTTEYSPLAGPNANLLAWVVGSEIDIFLPQVGPGDEFYANVAYGDGLLGEVSGNTPNAMDNFPGIKKSIGGLQIVNSNLQITSVNAAGVPLTVANNIGWGANSYYTHYWTPQWRSNLGAGYFRLNAAPSLSTNATTGLNTQLGSNSVFDVEGNIIWSPIKNFDIGTEVEWSEIRATIQNPTLAYVAAGSPGLNGNDWAFMFRVQRTF